MSTNYVPLYTLTEDKRDAVALVKAINRRARRHNYFAGGRQFGVDYTTWAVCYPQMAAAYQAAAGRIMGRNGRFMPPRFG